MLWPRVERILNTANVSQKLQNRAEVLVEVISEFPVGMLAVSVTGSQSFNHSFNQVKNLTPLLAVGILVPL